MADLIDREAVEAIFADESIVNWERKIRELPMVEGYSRGAMEQIMWERDVAISQLNDYGVQFGEQADCVRVVRCRDCDYSHEYTNHTFYCYYCGMCKQFYEFCSHGRLRRGD